MRAKVEELTLTTARLDRSAAPARPQRADGERRAPLGGARARDRQPDRGDPGHGGPAPRRGNVARRAARLPGADEARDGADQRCPPRSARLRAPRGGALASTADARARRPTSRARRRGRLRARAAAEAVQDACASRSTREQRARARRALGAAAHAGAPQRRPQRGRGDRVARTGGARRGRRDRARARRDDGRADRGRGHRARHSGRDRASACSSRS